MVLIDQQTLNVPADLATSLLEKYSQLTSAVQTEVEWLMTVAEAELSMASAAIRTINAVGSVPENPAVYDVSNFSFSRSVSPHSLPATHHPPPHTHSCFRPLCPILWFWIALLEIVR